MAVVKQTLRNLSDNPYLDLEGGLTLTRHDTCQHLGLYKPYVFNKLDMGVG